MHDLIHTHITHGTTIYQERAKYVHLAPERNRFSIAQRWSRHIRPITKLNNDIGEEFQQSNSQQNNGQAHGPDSLVPPWVITRPDLPTLPPTTHPPAVPGPARAQQGVGGSRAIRLVLTPLPSATRSGASDLGAPPRRVVTAWLCVGRLWCLFMYARPGGLCCLFILKRWREFTVRTCLHCVWMMGCFPVTCLLTLWNKDHNFKCTLNRHQT